MAGNPSGVKAQPIATNPLATARQLWALNKAGRLSHRDPVAHEVTHGPLTAQQADQAIKALHSARGVQEEG